MKLDLDVIKRAVHFDQHVHADTGPVLLGAWPGDIIYERSARAETNPMLLVDFRKHCAPRTLFWAPERKWPHAYPTGRPSCIWHNSSSCTVHEGWCEEPRKTIGENGPEYIWGTRYSCSIRHAAGEKPYYWRSYDPEAIARSPPYIRTIFADVGSYVTHKSAIKNSVLRRQRSAVANGMGFSGFRRMLEEAHLEEHQRRHRAHFYCCASSLDPSVRENYYFPEYDDTDYGGFLPSEAWMADAYIDQIERLIPFFNRCMEKLDGKILCGDHSHKIAKLVHVGGERAFEGLYSLMNEYGQIIGWWFVHSTNLSEVREKLKSVAKRFKAHGFTGPLLFFTDRCCTERSFFTEGTADDAEDVVFETLRGEGIQIASNISPKPVAVLPRAPALLNNADMINSVCGDILGEASASAAAGNDYVVGFDCEWKIGSGMQPAATVQLALPDDRSFVFHIARLSSIPPGLKTFP